MLFAKDYIFTFAFDSTLLLLYFAFTVAKHGNRAKQRQQCKGKKKC
jgi:hypothetical protein